jgi:hypothetical protein
MLGKVWVKGLAAMESMVVMLDDILEGCEAAVVHVGRCESHIAEGGHSKLAAVFGVGSGPEAATVRILSREREEPIVCEALVGEVGASVAVEAIGSPHA